MAARSLRCRNRLGAGHRRRIEPHPLPRRQAVASTPSHVVPGMLSSSKPRNSSWSEGCFGLATRSSQRLTWIQARCPNPIGRTEYQNTGRLCRSFSCSGNTSTRMSLPGRKTRLVWSCSGHRPLYSSQQSTVGTRHPDEIGAYTITPRRQTRVAVRSGCPVHSAWSVEWHG
jgi:hypothetical protein